MSLRWRAPEPNQIGSAVRACEAIPEIPRRRHIGRSAWLHQGTSGFPAIRVVRILLERIVEPYIFELIAAATEDGVSRIGAQERGDGRSKVGRPSIRPLNIVEE